MNKNLSLYLNVFNFDSLSYLLKKIKNAHAVRCSKTTYSKTKIFVEFLPWTYNLMLKVQSKQCNTSTQLIIDKAIIKTFWCSSIVPVLYFMEDKMKQNGVVNALSGSAALSAMGFALMQSGMTATIGAIALGFGLFLSAILGVAGLFSLLG